MAEGKDESKHSSTSRSSASYSSIWSLEALLADAQGSELFEEYLESEGLLPQLHFLFAVDGLKTTASNTDSPQKLAQKIRSISKLVDRLQVGLSKTTKTQIHNDQINLPPSVNVYDNARDEIESHMKINLLPNFLKSDIYLHNYVKLQTIIEEGCSNVGSTAGDPEDVPDGTSTITIPLDSDGNSTIIPDGVNKISSRDSRTETVPSTSQASSGSGNPVLLNLTSGALKATRRDRLDVTAPTSRLLLHHHPKKICSSASVQNPYHASYSSYNPVSRQDSEIQSLSSADGKLGTTGPLRKLDESNQRRVGASGNTRRFDTELSNDSFPRSFRPAFPTTHTREIPKFDQDKFTQELMERLEAVAKSPETRKKYLDSKIFNSKFLHINPEDLSKKTEEKHIRPQAIASALTALRKMQLGSQVEAPDDILDQHFQHIAKRFPDKTSIHSPPQPQHAVAQNIKKSNGNSRKKMDIYSIDSGIEFKTPGYEINPLKKTNISKQKPGTSIQHDSGVSVSSETNLPPPVKASSTRAPHHHQHLAAATPAGSSSLPKKPTTPPRYTIFIFYSDGPESKNNEPYRLSSDVILTLGQLKQQLPRRGNYRYFCKKVNSELNMFVQEEIIKDDEYLPLYGVDKIVVTLQAQIL